MMLNAQRTSTHVLSCILAVALTAALALAVPVRAYAETAAEYQSQANNLQAQADELSARVDEISTRLVEAHAAEADATAKYNEAEAQKTEALERKAAAEATISKTQGRLSSRVATMYRSGGALSLLDVLLGAGSFSEFLTAWEALETINAQDAALIGENRAARVEAAAAAELYEQQCVVAQEELERTSAARAEIESAQAQLSSELASMNEEIALLLAKEEEASAEEEAERQRQAEAARQAQAGDSSSGTKLDSNPTPFDSSVFDGWVIPCDYSYVSCEFGYSPITYSHNGIDLVASSGTPIYAAGPGTVTYVGWYGTGGNAVIISHGSGVQTIYMHQSQTAAYVGEYVNAGDHIGYVGSTGLSTGAHLHFQLSIDGSPVNPRNYFSF